MSRYRILTYRRKWNGQWLLRAEAERDRRARRTNAQGELEAAVKLRQASEIIGERAIG